MFCRISVDNDDLFVESIISRIKSGESKKDVIMDTGIDKSTINRWIGGRMKRFSNFREPEIGLNAP